MKNNFKTILLIIFIFLPLLITLLSLNYLPDTIPVHYGFNGQVNRWSSKYEALIIPIIGIIICLISLVSTSYLAKKSKYKDNTKSLNVCNIVLILIFNVLAISFLISYFKTITNISNEFSFKLIFVALGIIFVIIGNYLPKCKRNNFIGIRTTLTLSSDDIWFKTHRFGGKVFVIFGIAVAISSLFIPCNMLSHILVISLIIVTIILTIYPKKLVNKKN